MSDNEDSKFYYPKLYSSGLNHPLLLPAIPRIIIKPKNNNESEKNMNNNKINYLNGNYYSNNQFEYNNKLKINDSNSHNNIISDINYNRVKDINNISKSNKNSVLNNNIKIKKITNQNNIVLNSSNKQEKNDDNNKMIKNISAYNNYHYFTNQTSKKDENNSSLNNTNRTQINKICISAKEKIENNIQNLKSNTIENELLTSKIRFKSNNIIENNTSSNKLSFNTINKIEKEKEVKNEERKNNIQKTFIFDKAIFTSEFNSGNMYNCVKITDYLYEVEIASDCQDKLISHPISIYKVWFYFGVKCFSSSELIINIINLNNFHKIYKAGYQICVRELDYNVEPKDFEKTYKFGEEMDWKRYSSFSSSVDKQNNLILKIKYKFTKGKYVLFAFCFPFSYEKNKVFLSYINTLIIKNPLSKIYFNKEILIKSKENREINLLTITSKKNIIKNEYEQSIIGLFPEKNRCNKLLKDKPLIIISARVHPGETPGTHMMNGIIKFLTDEFDEKAEILRNNFIFKLIPMINVDGVSNGYYRLDTNGYNLNRCYLQPEYKLDPEIYAVKKLFLVYNSLYKIRYYFDLHADMNVKGVYTFGNAIEKFEKHIENVLFGFIFHLSCSHVNWNHCIYSEKSMKTKSKNDNNSKEATSRVQFYKRTGLIHTYTLESSYFKGDFDNDNNIIEDCKLYVISDFEKTGRDCLISILLYEELIVNENIKNSIYHNINGCREFIADYVFNHEERFNSDFSLKNTVKEINKKKFWKSVKEINDNKSILKSNRNNSQKIRINNLSLPKIMKKLESEKDDNNNNEKVVDDKNGKEEKAHYKKISFISKGKRTLTPINNNNNNNNKKSFNIKIIKN